MQQIADQSGLFSVELPRCTAWANSFLFMQDQVGRMSLLIKRFGWGCGGSPAQVGVVPSLRCRSAGLLLDPRGEEFTHLQSLAPHAAGANGQTCQFTKTKHALWYLIIGFYNQNILQMISQIKKVNLSQQCRANELMLRRLLMCSTIRWRSIKGAQQEELAWSVLICPVLWFMTKTL